MSSTRSDGPPPPSTSIDSVTSSALPALRPRGTSICVSSATVCTSWARPRPTIVSASSRARPSSFMKAPLPTLTSSTRAPVPSAIFFDMIELAIRGIDSTVPVMSRRAYSLRSAGARSGPAALITAPEVRSTSLTSSGVSVDRQPGIVSILSSVPPVWPRPRPAVWGTATPHAATRGHRTSETLSPTPPVECLSTVGLPTPERSAREPVAIICWVHRASSSGSRPRKRMAMSSAAACSSATRPSV